jgi:hypothetical protein
MITLVLSAQDGRTKVPRFKKEVVTTQFVSEGAATADVNKDGRIDIIAGAFWFEAPGWQRHEITVGDTFNIKAYSNAFLNFAMDVNQDGWMDYIRVDHPGEAVTWFENPRGRPGHWKQYLINKSLGNETPLLVDVDGDGRPDLVGNDAIAKQIIWLKSPSVKGDTAWTKIVVSADSTLGTHKYTHGVGLGDLNGDGRKDLLQKNGWFEAPVNRMQSNWKFHPATLSEDCSQMYVLDLNGDGLNDIISASAHDYGIWWHEQKKDGSWITHDIFRSFSESHALELKDLNGDGNPDLVTGKRFFAHNGGDPGGMEPAVLYWFEYKPGRSPSWVPHPIDDNSGVGLQVLVEDMNGDGLPDIVSGNKKGVHVFYQQP